MGGLIIGGEIGERVALGVAILGTASDAPANFGGDNCGAAGNPSGGFSSLTVGAALRVNLYAPKSDDGNERTWLYARALVGYALLQPGGMFSSGDILVMVGPGVDFITHLRHFSIGLEADFVFGVSHLQAGVVVEPHLKYSF
jgi:hypothetical protein